MIGEADAALTSATGRRWTVQRSETSMITVTVVRLLFVVRTTVRFVGRDGRRLAPLFVPYRAERVRNALLELGWPVEDRRLGPNPTKWLSTWLRPAVDERVHAMHRCPVCERQLPGRPEFGWFPGPGGAFFLEPTRKELIAKCPEHGRPPFNVPRR